MVLPSMSLDQAVELAGPNCLVDLEAGDHIAAVVNGVLHDTFDWRESERVCEVSALEPLRRIN